jgi:hypothetical protein
LGKDNRLQLWNADNGLNTITNYGKVPLNLAVAEASLQMSCTEFCLERYIYVPSNNNMLMYNIHEGTLKSTYKGIRVKEYDFNKMIISQIVVGII